MESIDEYYITLLDEANVYFDDFEYNIDFSSKDGIISIDEITEIVDSISSIRAFTQKDLSQYYWKAFKMRKSWNYRYLFCARQSMQG